MIPGGARGRTTLEATARLGPRWAVQPKLDGVVVRVRLDAQGRCAGLLSRGGANLGAGPGRSLMGARLGWSNSVLIGELEAWTERSIRAVRTRGYTLLHLFDIERAEGGRFVGRDTYRARRDLLWRMQSEIVNLAGEVPWVRDAEGDAHSRLTGRYVEGHPTDWRLAPIVPQVPTARIDEAWGRWGPDSDGEGLVVVDLDAPLGGRRSKLKIKATDELDCTVVSVGRTAVRLEWRGHLFAVSKRGDMSLTVGEIVSVAHEGWQEKSVRPRFARLVRRRPDLLASTACH